LEEDPIPPSEYVPDIPIALEEIVLKVLSKEPAARYRTADQLGRVLLRFGTQRDVTSNSALSLTPEANNSYQQPERSLPNHNSHKPAFSLPEITVPDVEVSLPDIDWISVGLGLLALIAVGGLIPFWIIIINLYNP
jgi:hypothetical protein